MNRLLLWLAALVLTGCGPAALVQSDAGADTAAPVLSRQIAFVPGTPLLLEPGAQVDLAVSVTDFSGAPVPDADVRFALLGTVLDAALNPPRARTGSSGADLGIARTTMRAPSDSATLRVRASAAQAVDVYLDVSVSARGFGSISVSARYAGNRQPTGLAADLFVGIGCDRVSTADPVRSATLPVTGATVHFGPLAAGDTFAVRATAVGSDGTVLATGCSDGLTIARDHDTATTLAFTDEPLRADGGYACAMQLSLAGPVAAGLPQWTAAIAAAEGGSLDDATYLLDAIGDAVERRSGTTARADFDRAVRDGLGAQLAMYLAAHHAGPTPVLGTMAADVARMLMNVSGSLQLSVDADAVGGMSVVARAFSLVLDPLTPDVASDDVSLDLDGAGTGELRIGANDRAILTLRGVPLPLPAVASAARKKLIDRLGVATTSEWLRIVTDCDAIAALVSGSTGTCDVACVSSACGAALDHVAAQFDGAIGTVGSSYSTVAIRVDGTVLPVSGTLEMERMPQGALEGAYIDAAVISFSGSAEIHRP